MKLIGRERELDELARLMDAPRSGMSAAIVVRGEAGVGKTSLLRHVIDAAAADFQVAAVSGFEAEVDLGFATLHRLLVPYQGLTDGLPTAQRDALSSALGYEAGPPPDRFLVGLATLTLLSDLAAARPLLCVLDDAQWIDDASLSVLTFVARRLYADRVAMIFGLRDTDGESVAVDGIQELRVSDLDEAAAHSLLDMTADTPFDPRVAERIIAETSGNPLALTELAGELTADQRSGAVPLPDVLPVGTNAQARYQHRVRALGADTQRILLLAAAEQGDLAVVWRAAERRGIDADEAIGPAVDADLVRAYPQIEFRHPLIRSAIYHGAALPEQRRAHQELAAALDPQTDPDRRAWHRACAAFGPDEDVAAELEAAADRARGRGVHSAEVRFLDRAAELTADPDERARRLLTAATAAHAAGRLPLARRLLDQAETTLSDPNGQGRALRLRGLMDPAQGAFRQGVANLVAAARAFLPQDPAFARETLLDAFTVYAASGRYSEGVTSAEIAALALSIPATDPSSPSDRMLDGWSTVILGDYEAGAALLRDAVHTFAYDDAHRAQAARWTQLACLAARELWDDDAFHEINARNTRRLSDLGQLDRLQIGLLSLAAGYVHRGELASADRCYADVRMLRQAIGGTAELSEFVDLQLRAWRGDDSVRETAEGIYELSDAIGFNAGVCIAQLALTTLELSEGHFSRALAAARISLGPDNLGVECRALADLVEAAFRAGEEEEARDAFGRFAPRLAISGTDWALGVRARLQGLLAPDDDAEAWFEEALERLNRTKVTTDRARTHLAFGEWLRGTGRLADAREQLRLAHDLFATIGAAGYAERARTELRATGVRARRRAAATSNDLTPQEHHISRLAASGATNREIATQMFLSTSTVDYHLRKAFRKLDITTRRHLAEAMQSLATRDA